MLPFLANKDEYNREVRGVNSKEYIRLHCRPVASTMQQRHCGYFPTAPGNPAFPLAPNYAACWQKQVRKSLDQGNTQQRSEGEPNPGPSDRQSSALTTMP